MKRIGVFSLLVILVMGLLLLPWTFAEELPLSISATPNQGVAPLHVQFSANTTLDIKEYVWDFNDDGEIDSRDAAPTTTFSNPGESAVKLIVTLANGSTQEATATISIHDQISISVTANPSSGQAPLTVQFTTAAAGKGPLSYSWDFNADGSPDSTLQNPSTTYETAGTQKAIVTVIDADGNRVGREIQIKVAAFEVNLSLSSYFPTTLAKGENQVTFIFSNNGESTLRDLTGKIIGKGLQHLSSSSIGSLKPKDEDSLTVKMNVLETGTLSGNIRIAEKSFPVEFTVVKEISYDKEELQAQFAMLREKFDEQEAIYTDKKAEGFLVADVFESIKITKKQVQDVQQDLLKENFAQAKIGLDLAASSIDDITKDLEAAKKQKVTVLQWVKENAIAVAAIIAALGTLSGFLVKVRLQAKKVGETVGVHAKKMGENVKEHLAKKKAHKAQENNDHSSQDNGHKEKSESKGKVESKEEQPPLSDTISDESGESDQEKKEES